MGYAHSTDELLQNLVCFFMVFFVWKFDIFRPLWGVVRDRFVVNVGVGYYVT